MTALLFLLTMKVMSIDAFNITSYLPESGSTDLEEGDSLDLWCNADDYWEWCKFTNKNSRRWCELQWETEANNVTVNNCDDFKERFEYLGDYDNYRCGLRIYDIHPDESGEWTCKLDDYDGNGYGFGTQVERSFEVRVKVKTTTTTSTTTTTTTTTTPRATTVYEENTDEFRFTSYIPESGSTSLREGDSLDIWCNVNDYWEWCAFKHVPSERFCDLKWDYAAYNVTVDNCADFKGRMEYLGDYDNYKCGVRFHSIRPDESGEWRCELENYYYAQTKRGYGYEVRKSLLVNVSAAESS